MRVLALLLLVGGLGACRGLTPLQLDHLIQAGIEARVGRELAPHHDAARREWPAAILTVALEDPEGLAEGTLRDRYFESMFKFLASPRRRGVTCPESRQTLVTALRASGLPTDDAWRTLANPDARRRILAEFARIGAAVDYFAKGTLGRIAGKYQLELELRDAATWAVVGAAAGL